jgi:hypothetical protein
VSEKNDETEKAIARRVLFTSLCESGFSIWSLGQFDNVTQEQRDFTLGMMVFSMECGYQFALKERKEAM